MAKVKAFVANNVGKFLFALTVLVTAAAGVWYATQPTWKYVIKQDMQTLKLSDETCTNQTIISNFLNLGMPSSNVPNLKSGVVVAEVNVPEFKIKKGDSIELCYDPVTHAHNNVAIVVDVLGGWGPVDLPTSEK